MKIERHEEKVRLGGFAEKDGVVIQAAKVVDFIGAAGNTYKASVGPDGLVDCQVLPDDVVQPEIMGKIKTESKKVLKVCIIAGIFFLICSKDFVKSISRNSVREFKCRIKDTKHLLRENSAALCNVCFQFFCKFWSDCSCSWKNEQFVF